MANESSTLNEPSTLNERFESYQADVYRERDVGTARRIFRDIGLALALTAAVATLVTHAGWIEQHVAMLSDAMHISAREGQNFWTHYVISLLAAGAGQFLTLKWLESAFDEMPAHDDDLVSTLQFWTGLSLLFASLAAIALMSTASAVSQQQDVLGYFRPYALECASFYLLYSLCRVLLTLLRAL